jgi:hypothetical protein
MIRPCAPSWAWVGASTLVLALVGGCSLNPQPLPPVTGESASPDAGGNADAAAFPPPEGSTDAGSIVDTGTSDAAADSGVQETGGDSGGPPDAAEEAGDGGSDADAALEGGD